MSGGGARRDCRGIEAPRIGGVGRAAAGASSECENVRTIHSSQEPPLLRRGGEALALPGAPLLIQFPLETSMTSGCGAGGGVSPPGRGHPFRERGGALDQVVEPRTRPGPPPPPDFNPPPGPAPESDLHSLSLWPADGGQPELTETCCGGSHDTGLSSNGRRQFVHQTPPSSRPPSGFNPPPGPAPGSEHDHTSCGQRTASRPQNLLWRLPRHHHLARWRWR